MQVFWHSAAHVLGAALEAQFGAHVQLCDGPAVLDAEGGFFYEMHLRDAGVLPDVAAAPQAPAAASSVLAPPATSSQQDGPAKLRITEEVYAPLEALARRIISQRAAFERLSVSREFAQRMFADNRFKLDMLARIPASEPVTLYRCGPFVDLCRGPHVPHTGVFKGFALFKSSGSHWQPQAPGGRDEPVSTAQAPLLLQRAYGIAFPTASQQSAWARQLEDARARDHRVIGRAQSLFFFHELSPGSVFMLPHGTRIYNKARWPYLVLVRRCS